ncbi:hypothetical protein THAOC_20376, partial [Thalassiosira oceanica]
MSANATRTMPRDAQRGSKTTDLVHSLTRPSTDDIRRVGSAAAAPFPAAPRAPPDGDEEATAA